MYNQSSSPGPQSPGAIAYEMHLAGMEEDEELSDTEELLGGPAGPEGRKNVAPSISKWPVVLSVVGVFSVLGGLVALADYFQSDPVLYDRACLDGFSVAEHLGEQSPYPTDSQATSVNRECSLVHLSLIARSGIRNPTEDAVQDLDRLENWIHANLPPDPVSGREWLTNWTNEYTEDAAGQLSQVGQLHFQRIGARFSDLYTDLMDVTIGDRMRVRSTPDGVTSASAEAFLQGFFGSKWENFTAVDSVIKGDDEALKFSDRCHVFTDLYSKLSAESSRSEALLLEKVGKSVSRKLNAPNTMKLEDVVAMIAGCVLDLAEKGRDDRFCELIAPEEWLRLEVLREDVSPFLHANETYPFLSQPLWLDLLESFNQCQRTDDSECTKLDFRFGTESALLPFLLRAGLSGRPCYGTVSSLAPFAGNIAFEMYRGCTVKDYDGEKLADQDIVRVRLHENYVREIPFCGMKDYCNLDEIRSFVEELIGDEGWDSLCETVLT